MKKAEQKIQLEDIKKNKHRKTKLQKEALKVFVFEKSSYGYTQAEIAEMTGYTPIYICEVMKEIEDEYILELGKDKEYQIRKQIKRLEGITKKLYKALEAAETAKDIVALQGQILKTEEYKAKLQGFFVEVKKVEGELTNSFINSLNMIQ